MSDELNELIERAKRLGGHITVSVPIARVPNTSTDQHIQICHSLDDSKPSHSPDFATVRWGGVIYHFSGKQRIVVACLWDAWERGVACVDQYTLMRECETDCEQLRDLFRRHPAWGTVIQRGSLHGGSAGTYCLAV
jgi:hypothetical protein